MQAHQLPHPSSWAHGFRHAGAIQIDDEHLGLSTALSDEEIADVKVAMTSARVVKTPDRGARGCCCSKQATVARGGREPDPGIERVFFEDGSQSHAP